MNNEYYVLKEIPKLNLYKTSEIYAVLNEPIILKKINKYDFLPKIISSFQDYDNLYLVTNFFEGDILHNYKNEIFSEEKIKFISACVIQSLIYLRKQKIINRDIRMKNIIMDKNRYVNVIDFSYAIEYSNIRKNQTNIITNKLEISPEILNHSSYDYNVDYYNLGVVIYYLIFKKYVNRVKKQNNLTEIFIDSKNIKNYTSTCIDFLNKLLITDYKTRIGFNNIDELKNHLWFKGFNWKKLKKKKMKSPLIYMKKKPFTFECHKFKISNLKRNKFINLLKKIKYKFLFKNYDFVNKDIINKFLISINSPKNKKNKMNKNLIK